MKLRSPKKHGILSRVILVLATFAISSTSYAQQKVSVSGINLGMSLTEAKNQLSGYTIAPARVNGYLPSLQVLSANKEGEALVLEAIDDKVAYVERYVALPPDKAVDKEAYTRQLVAKFGKPSAIDVYLWWRYDPHGSPLAVASALDPRCRDITTQQIGIVASDIQPFKPSNRAGNWPPPLQGVMQLPATNVPRCFGTVLRIGLDRSTTNIPSNAVDALHYQLSDYSYFIPAVARQIEKQRAAADAKKKATMGNAGPTP